jgi:hypothetical protein
MAWSPPGWILVSTVPCCVLKDHIIYLNRTLGSVSQALAVVTNRHTTQEPSLVPMTLPTTQALSPSIQPVLLICLEQSMRDGISVLLTRWAELGTQLLELRQPITLEGTK